MSNLEYEISSALGQKTHLVISDGQSTAVAQAGHNIANENHILGIARRVHSPQEIVLLVPDDIGSVAKLKAPQASSYKLRRIAS